MLLQFSHNPGLRENCETLVDQSCYSFRTPGAGGTILDAFFTHPGAGGTILDALFTHPGAGGTILDAFFTHPGAGGDHS